MRAPIEIRDSVVRAGAQKTSSLAVNGARSTLTHALKINTAFGLPLSYAVLVFWDISNYKQEKKKFAQEYAMEIGAILGKSPRNVTSKDFETVAAENPTLGEALHRSKLKRNLRLVSNLISMSAAFAVGTALVFSATATLGLTLLGMAAGYVTFMAADRIVTAIGNRALHLKEPKLKDVEKNLSLQKELSIPSQVKYLEWLQDRRLEITPEQVTTLLSKANPNAQITDAQTRQLAEDLTNRLINAQELAFIAYGQTSGVPMRNAPELSALEAANAKLTQQAQVIREQASQLSEKASDMGSTAKDKAAEFGSTVKEKTGEWTNRIHPKKQPQDIINEKLTQGPQSAADTVLNQRQQQAEQPAGIGV